MHRVPARTWLLATVAALVVSVAPASAATNLLSNPGFEDGGGSFTSWTIGQGSTYFISDASTDNIFRSGAAAAKIFGEGTNCPIPNFDVTLFGQEETGLTAGDIYEFSGFVFVSSADSLVGADPCGSNRCVAKIVFFDSAVGGLELASNEIVIGDETTPLDTWTPFSVSTPAPAGAMRAEVLVIFLQPGCDMGAVFVDDVSLCQTAPPPAPANKLVDPSFDNGIASWQRFGANEKDEARAAYVRTPAGLHGAVKLFGPFNMDGDASGLFQSFAATPGLDWKFQVWSKRTCDAESEMAPGNLNFAVAKIVFKDGTGTEVGSAEKIVEDASTPNGPWTHHTVVATAPAGAVTTEALLIFVQPIGGPLGDPGGVWFDDAVLQEAVFTDAPILAESSLDFQLRQNMPNPFTQSTRIDFVLPRQDAVSLSVYDVAGRRVAKLLDGAIGSGSHSVTWNGTLSNGKPAATGVYQYVLQTSTGKTSRRMMLIK